MWSCLTHLPKEDPSNINFLLLCHPSLYLCESIHVVCNIYFLPFNCMLTSIKCASIYFPIYLLIYLLYY